MKSIISIFALTALAEAVSYDGYQLVRVATDANERTKSSVKSIVSDLALDEWIPCTASSGQSDILVPAAGREAFAARTEGLDVEVLLADVGVAVANNLAFDRYEAGSAADSWYNSYHPYADHVQYINDLAKKYPNNSRVVSAGKTYEGRDIPGLHIYGANSGPGKKPAIVWHGNVHAREWITSMTVEYMASRILATKRFLGRYDFYIFPIVNVDGFRYSQSADRLWRKNRAPTPNPLCVGTDINRNWPYKWDVPGGSSTNPCDATYRGTAAGSAPETKVLSAQLQKVKAAQGLKQYIDWHSYSQLFMTPYGYSCTDLPANNAELQTLAKGFADNLRAVYGTNYTTGPICTTIYPATGSSVDWTDAVAQSDYTFTAELRDRGQYGFLLPKEQIRPTGVETWRGIVDVLKRMT